MLTPTHAEFIAIAPELILTLTAGLVLIVEAFLPGLRRYLSGLALLAIAGAIWARLSLELPGAVWAGILRIDQLTAFSSENGGSHLRNSALSRQLRRLHRP